MPTAAEYAEGIWGYVPRTTVTGSGASATNRAEEYAVGGWAYATRSVTGAAHPPFGRTHRRRKFSGPVGDAFELNGESPQSAGLVAWWPALASRGTGVWRDLAGGNHLALNGGASFVGDAEMGWGVGYDGVNDYAEASATDLFESQSRGTIAGWVRFSSFASFNDLFASWIPAGNDGLLLTANASGQLYVQRFKAAAPAVNDAVQGGTALSVNTWYHIALTSNGSAWQIYINGKPESLTTLSGTNSGRWFSDLAATGHAFRLGRADTTYIAGREEDWRVYSRDLSAAEIFQLCAPATRRDLCRPLKKRAIAIPLGGSGALTLSLSELLAFTEARALGVGKGLAEALSLAETRSLGIARALAETLSYSDARTLGAARVLAESLAFTDTRRLGAARVLSETLALVETQRLGPERRLTEALSFTDAVNASLFLGLALVLNLSEALTLTVALTRGAGKGISESLTLSEVRALGIARKLVESVALTDTRRLGIAKALTESVSLSVLLSALLGGGSALTLHLVESLSLADQATLLFVILRYLATLERLPKPVAALLTSIKPIATLELD